MGFYAPAQLVRDARAHGVEVRPVDVWASAAEAALEPPAAGGAAAAAPWPVRLGFNQVAGLRADAAARIVAARADGPFAGAEDLARRAALDAGALALLARANALVALPVGPRGASRRPPEAARPGLGDGPATGRIGHRHQAAWAVAGVDTRATPLLQRTRTHEAPAVLDAPGAAEDLIADYRSTGLSLVSHPLALLRAQLAAFKVQPAAVLRGCRHGQLARASGLVTHRQRPETAKGVVFVTLEDETGAVNVIVWPDVVEAQRRPLLASRLLTVYGVWQREGEGARAVMHLVARKLVDHTALLQGLATRSRDFR
jgi:error-prone DNA polymerase